MIYKDMSFDGERALYGVKNAVIKNCRIDGPVDGESFAKQTQNLDVSDCFFNLRYPFWHLTDGNISNCEMTEFCRAAFWYDKNITIDNCKMMGIKALRECDNVTIKNSVVKSPEFIWKVRNINVSKVEILDSEYPFFEVENAKIDKLKMKGKYSFQYCNNIEIADSNFDTKDAFWHSKNVTVRDSLINGEYLAWYSENLTLINCKIIGTQPFCYCKNLRIINCTMENCDLAFENSSVYADVHSKIDSIKNPLSGEIKAPEIGEVILDAERVPVTECKIIEGD
ncbi:DUF3737 family protein [Treponema sp. Marseille-Q3903]|uniref:DUF3737 family protein n=1 Tax=Treponema sp. Marseille-Q3903 TaxID=2766703 RepID=UPI001651E769|nr:DUF3737 family protein [Treponema sp. Marseille-Q3903]MBC6714516.1 DUF3737 family protein [Treponema sp. Marseille-Q3903]